MCLTFTRRCLAILVARRLKSDDVLACLTDLFFAHGAPEHLRSDNGPEFVAASVRDWLGRIGVKTLYIEPGSLTICGDGLGSSTLVSGGRSPALDDFRVGSMLSIKGLRWPANADSVV